MKGMPLPLVVSLLITLGCRTIPGQDVRYEPTPMAVVRAMLEMADVGPSDIVYDLGSGDGRIPILAAKEFGARGVGIEIDPALVLRARENARQASVADRVEFRLGDMYAASLDDATVVTLFLHPKPNLKLRPRLRTDLQPGARVVSYIWDMGDWTPDAVGRVNGRRIFRGGSHCRADGTDWRPVPGQSSHSRSSLVYQVSSEATGTSPNGRLEGLANLLAEAFGQGFHTAGRTVGRFGAEIGANSDPLAPGGEIEWKHQGGRTVHDCFGSTLGYQVTAKGRTDVINPSGVKPA